MRQIGTISNLELVERFADHLRAEGIACTVDQVPEGFRIWVHDDDRVAAAKDEFTRFLAEPDHSRYQDASKRAMSRIREEMKQQQAARERTVIVSETWKPPTAQSYPLTLGLIAMSVVVAYFTNLKPQINDPRVLQILFSDDFTLQPILHGEVWRLITPIFLHFGLMHLVFNMMMLQQFGMHIESRRGTLKFLVMVVVIAVLSNFAQFWREGPVFGGMSGVVYGLFGYIWIKGRLEPGRGFDLPQQTVTVMLVWFTICAFGIVDHVANWAHGGGLVTGMAIAACGTFFKQLMRRK